MSKKSFKSKKNEKRKFLFFFTLLKNSSFFMHNLLELSGEVFQKLNIQILWLKNLISIFYDSSSIPNIQQKSEKSCKTGNSLQAFFCPPPSLWEIGGVEFKFCGNNFIKCSNVMLEHSSGHFVFPLILCFKKLNKI